jgi:WD40 repeat protein
VAIVRPGNRAVTFSSDGWGALWDLAAQKQLASLHTEDGASVRQVSAAADGREFVVADASGFAFVFDSLSGTLKRKVGKAGTPLVAAEISPQGDKVLTADSNGLITVWSLADGRALQSINDAVDAHNVNDVHFSPDGSTILAACADGKARTWNTQSGQPQWTVAEEGVPEEPRLYLTARYDRAHGSVVLAGMQRVRYSPDGSFFAGTNESAHILVWNAKTGKQLLRFEGHTGRVTSLAFSLDGTRLGSSSEDGTARIWDLELESRSPAEIKQKIAEISQKALR